MRPPIRAPWTSCAAVLASLALGPATAQDPGDGLETITVDEITDHVVYLSSPALEGRDSPSVGQELAAEHIARVYADAGLEYAPDSAQVWTDRVPAVPPPAWSRRPQGGEGKTYLRPFRVGELPGRNAGRPYSRPVPGECALELTVAEEPALAFTYGTDFVPLAGYPGEARGELAWVGYGIQNTSERYDDFRGVEVAGRIALVVAGEPRHRRKFDGPEVTAEASLWNKIDALADARAAGAILVRRPSMPEESAGSGKSRKKRPASKNGDGEDARPVPPLSYRYTWATWMIPSTDRPREGRIPTVEVSIACASELLGKDVETLAAKIDKSGNPTRVRVEEREIFLRASIEERPVELHNVVGFLPGTDPTLAKEVVVVGAHYDHVGVDARGRIGYGADDNASGTAAMLEIVQALAADPPRRSVLFAAFSGEEDGLLGSKDLAGALPVPTESVVAMVNLDMLGRGDAREVVCMGFRQNPGMQKVVERANDLARTGIRRIEPIDDPGIFERSDHKSFHDIGVPVVFFLEGYPIEQNKDYHTWRDTADKIDADKITNTARLAFLTAWTLANDDERLPPPER